MINPEGTQTTFWRICDDEGNCHCDWRLTLIDCYEDAPMRIIYTINAVGSAIVTVIGTYHSQIIPSSISVYSYTSTIISKLFNNPIYIISSSSYLSTLLSYCLSKTADLRLPHSNRFRSTKAY